MTSHDCHKTKIHSNSVRYGLDNAGVELCINEVDMLVDQGYRVEELASQGHLGVSGDCCRFGEDRTGNLYQSEEPKASVCFKGTQKVQENMREGTCHAVCRVHSKHTTCK